MSPLHLPPPLMDGAAPLVLAHGPANHTGKQRLPALCSLLVSLYSSWLLLLQSETIQAEPSVRLTQSGSQTDKVPPHCGWTGAASDHPAPHRVTLLPLPLAIIHFCFHKERFYL